MSFPIDSSITANKRQQGLTEPSLPNSNLFSSEAIIEKTNMIGNKELKLENKKDFSIAHHIDRNLISKLDNGHTFLYLPKQDIKSVGIVKSKESYQDAIRQFPIPCVDVFLFNPIYRTYFLVLRKDPPAKDRWWLPGGRLYKGESFFDCSVRKCQEEVGLDVTPLQTLDFVATLFPDSMWNTQTHTVNCIVFAKVNNGNAEPNIDQTCHNYKWKHINEDISLEDDYVINAHKKALRIIEKFDLCQNYAS